MPLPVQNFPILSFEQTHPVLAGMNYGADIGGKIISNLYNSIRARYAPQEMQQDLLTKQLAAQKAQAELPYAGPKSKADLYETLANIPYKEALTRLALEGTLPEAQAKAYKERQMIDIYNKLLQEDSSTYGQPIQPTLRQQTQPIVKPEPSSPLLSNLKSAEQISPDITQAIPQPEQSQMLDSLKYNATQTQVRQPLLDPNQGQNLIQSLNPYQRKLLKFADFEAALQGHPIPSVQPAIEQMKIIAQEDAKSKYIYQNKLDESMAKDMQDYSFGFSKRAQTANNNLDNLRQLQKYNNAAQLSGWWTKYFPGIASTDPNYVSALKASNALIMSGIGNVAADHPGRVLDSMMSGLKGSLPGPQMPREAVKALTKQLTVSNDLVIAQNNLVQKYKNLIKDPASLSTAITNVSLAYTPVDQNGNLMPEVLNHWNEIITPEMMLKASTSPLPRYNVRTKGKDTYVRINNEWYQL